MRRYGDLDDKDLVDTGRWKTIESASRYAQTVVREAARRADLLPTPPQVIALPRPLTGSQREALEEAKDDSDDAVAG
jgi:hypothetical protein